MSKPVDRQVITNITKEPNENEENIYDDLPLEILEDASHLSEKLPKKRRRLDGEQTCNHSVGEGQSVTQNLESLQGENIILRRNICVLYRTALAEIGRKDKLIASLREELENEKRQNQQDKVYR
mmetsp:Transcript_42161/g.82705  ORF Transcript_42161/g.82705 Transcript_42161/m.82705 type:complete len:124 (+) Transcript_42161:89-460(+)